MRLMGDMLRPAGLAAMLLATGLAFGPLGTARAQELEASIVETLDTLVGGPHPGLRANHTKGVMATGSFTATPAAAAISTAAHLQGGTVPVLVRFSDTTGVPDMPDTSPNARPHGMAIRFTLPDGGATDIVAISQNGFPVATPEEFLALLQAVAASGPDAPQPPPIVQFLDTHPAAKAFVSVPKPAPVSFATLPFFGVNAFRFINAAGQGQFGRYEILPVAGTQILTEAETAAKSPDYLMQDLPARLATGPIAFRLVLQLAGDGDPITDATQSWPADRPRVELGTITLDQAVPDSKAVEKAVMFNPLSLPDGIEPSDDPILLSRPGAYAISFSRRVE